MLSATSRALSRSPPSAPSSPAPLSPPPSPAPESRAGARVARRAELPRAVRADALLEGALGVGGSGNAGPVGGPGSGVPLAGAVGSLLATASVASRARPDAASYSSPMFT